MVDTIQVAAPGSITPSRYTTTRHPPFACMCRFTFATSWHTCCLCFICSHCSADNATAIATQAGSHINNPKPSSLLLAPAHQTCNLCPEVESESVNACPSTVDKFGCWRERSQGIRRRNSHQSQGEPVSSPTRLPGVFLHFPDWNARHLQRLRLLIMSSTGKPHPASLHPLRFATFTSKLPM